MASPFIGEIRLFCGDFAPRGWALCTGQLLPIAQFQTLFAVLGTTYGGNGSSNFALPNFQGSVVMHAGVGPDGNQYPLGSEGGSITATLVAEQLPAHTHVVNASIAPATTGTIDLRQQQALGVASIALYGPATTLTDMVLSGAAGAGFSHSNTQPYLGLNFIIALQGAFPLSG